MTTPTSVPPPGWYGAGTVGQERWWDGLNWTEHTRALPVAPPPGTGRIFAYSSASTSLVVAIIVVVLALPGLPLSVLLLVSGNPMGLLTALFTLAFGALAVSLFLNYSKLSRQV